MNGLDRGLKLLFLLLAVTSIVPLNAQDKNPLFTLMKPAATGLKFTNTVREDDSLHVLLYEYLYNGHGIGVGDFNNDGLQDVFISGNTTPHKLFLNKGNLRFKDITKEASVKGNGTWSTGVSVADVNSDGLLDIYVCHSGKFEEARLANELFINTGIVNGIPVFKEHAKSFGLDAPGTQSTQAAFFDYDKDGDLDMFLLNHSMNTYYAFLNTREQRATPDFRYGNRLFRNDTPRGDKTNVVFTDVTLQAGIINNPLNYGLSVNISDINQDGWPDIYSTSDYSEHDCYYVNNRDGTFTQSLQQSFQHISKFSMGADVADYNNDGLPDVFTLDMLPADNHRQKLLKGPDEYDQYHLMLDSGYYRQHMRNMLQLNRGKDAHGNVRFSEIGQLAGLSNTDWSWAGLFADLNADGWKDLMITNGYLRDFTDLDFLKYTMPNAQLNEAAKGNLNFKSYELVKKMPSNKLSNYLFSNKGDLTFEDVTQDWGFYTPTVSNAAAYADLDNDGDLDLIIGNNNAPVMVWRNNLERQRPRWLQVELKSRTGNRFALGAKAWLYAGHEVQYQELYPVRGFQSSNSPVVYFGLGLATPDSLMVEWPSGKVTVLHQPGTNQIIHLTEEEAVARENQQRPPKDKRIFTKAPAHEQLNFLHRENDFVDFKVEVLMPYQLSRMGPALAKGDVNGDGNEDVFIGGAIGQSAALYIQHKDGTFTRVQDNPWQAEANSEDVNALFFDADNDQDLDLYVVNGGNEYLDESIEFQDRLYLNDGTGRFAEAVNALPAMLSNKHAVAAGDLDGDGDLDLFIGGRGNPGYFPLASRSYLLRNDSQPGQVVFTDITKSNCPELQTPGMVTTACWADLNNDAFPELLIAGDWMPILLFTNAAGTLKPLTEASGMEKMYGQWTSMLVKDVDNDGDQDIIMGNSGLNHQFNPSAEQPMSIHVKDFDNDGAIDPIVSYYIQGKSYPMASRDELLDQIPALKKKYVKYIDYADATLETIFGQDQLADAKVMTCTETKSTLFLQDGNLKFVPKPLPLEAQFSTVQSILADDYDQDGNVDLVLLGNFFPYRTQLGENDASLGLYLKGNGTGNFEAVAPFRSGLFADGDIRAGVQVKNVSGKKKLVIAKNNGLAEVISIQQP